MNETYERYLFNKRDQRDETFESFLADIRSMIKTCNFHAESVDSILRDTIVLGIQDGETQRALLKERHLTLATVITICKTAESATLQTKNLRNEVNKVAISSRQAREKKLVRQDDNTLHRK